MYEVLASIALGANLGEPAATIRYACQLLGQTPGIIIKKYSSLYQSKPMGPSNQPDYINAAILVQVSLEPLPLLDCLQTIEIQCGRLDKRRYWGEREIDLDMITYNNRIIRHERLTVPHPGAYQRCFVLAPLVEIDPGLEIRGYGNVADLLKDCVTGTAVKVATLNVMQ